MTTAWLIQITPDSRNPVARQDLRDAVRMHKRVMTLVPDNLGDQPRHTAGVLYRIDHTRTGPRILIQTLLPPDTTHLPASYGSTETRELTPLLTWIRPQALVRYRIAANTCRRNGHTTTALRGDEAAAWWPARASAAGLSLKTVSFRPLDDAVGGPHPNGIRHAMALFDGTALVTDADLLRHAVTTGIGHGRSHGCGLLSIAPAR